MVCFIIWLAKQLFIKVGWMKATDGEDSCSLTVTKLIDKKL